MDASTEIDLRIDFDGRIRDKANFMYQNSKAHNFTSSDNLRHYNNTTTLISRVLYSDESQQPSLLFHSRQGEWWQQQDFQH
jgi:hypothetical protein